MWCCFGICSQFILRKITVLYNKTRTVILAYKFMMKALLICGIKYIKCTILGNFKKIQDRLRRFQAAQDLTSSTLKYVYSGEKDIRAPFHTHRRHNTAMRDKRSSPAWFMQAGKQNFASIK